MTRPLLSLVLATVGRTEEVHRLLASLITQTDRRFELVVVDQNPDDRLVCVVADAAAHGIAVRHLRQPERNLSTARNLGLRHAQGEFISFPDDDCWYDDAAVASVLAAFAVNSGVQGVVACWYEQAMAAGRTPMREALNLEAWRRYRGGDASSITLFFRRRLFEQIGGFDERFGVGQWFGAGEEIDLIFRALEADLRIDREPEALVHHAFGRLPPGGVLQAWRNARRRAHGTGGLYAKHRLSAHVIVRGFCAPLLLALARQPHPVRVAAAAGTCLGRIEGFVRYRVRRLPRVPVRSTTRPEN